jgi:predicted peroxiredoxin/TusA-related sulfurtransferase
MVSANTRRTNQESIDVRGKTITTFILYSAAAKLQGLKEGDVLEVLTDAFEPIESDIRAWCRMTGHKLAAVEKEPDCERYHIEKGTPKGKEHRLAVVISDAGLEELISPLGFALGAALAGTEVAIYFQGPAVRVLAKGFKARLKGMGRFFSSFAEKGLAQAGHLPPQDKLRQLKELGARFYVCGPSMEHFGVKKAGLAFDDVVVAEYLTFIEVMHRADTQMYV